MYLDKYLLIIMVAIKEKIGKDLNTEDGYNAAKRCALVLLRRLKKPVIMIYQK